MDTKDLVDKAAEIQKLSAMIGKLSDAKNYVKGPLSDAVQALVGKLQYNTVADGEMCSRILLAGFDAEIRKCSEMIHDIAVSMAEMADINGIAVGTPSYTVGEALRTFADIKYNSPVITSTLPEAR